MPSSPSPSALRRRLLEVVPCDRKRSCGVGDVAELCPRLPRPRESERLVELLQAKTSDSGSNEMMDAETRLKSEAFEELQRLVGRLQLGGHNASGDRVEVAAATAMKVWRPVKDDSEARETLMMLRAIAQGSLQC